MEQSISRIKSQELTLDRCFFSLWTSGCAWALGIGKWEGNGKVTAIYNAST